MPKWILWIFSAAFFILACFCGLNIFSLFLVISGFIVMPLSFITKAFEKLNNLKALPVITAFLISFGGLGISHSFNNTAAESSDISYTFLSDSESENAENNTSGSLNLSDYTYYENNLSSKSADKENSSTHKSTYSSVTSSKATEKEKLNIEIISLSSPALKGNEATLEIKGEPCKTYSIAVYYSSKSSASGLVDKESDQNGMVSWNWKIGAKTKSGNYKIIISCENKETEIPFTVE